MKSNSPFQQNSCAAARKEFKAGYMNRTNKTPEENLKEYNREKNEFYCNKDTNFKMKLRPSGDDDIPYTDEQIKQGKKEKS